jgi:hypothetical protein
MRPLDTNPRRCQERQPGTGWQCGSYAGHEGSHTALIASDLFPERTERTERPLIFSAPMLKTLLAGRKSQTRRLVKPQPTRTLPNTETVGDLDIVREQGWRWQQTKTRHVYVSDRSETSFAENLEHSCPYGVPGDRLWVKETWHPCDGGTLYAADYTSKQEAGIERWQSPLYMPRAESRITLELTGVRVERIQETSAADIMAEGVVERPHDDPILGRCPVSAFDGVCYPDLRSLWASGWNAINGKRAPWAGNPWVWVLEFRRLP